MKYTQADLYRWAHQIISARKTANFLEIARNKPDHRFATELAKQTIEFAQDDDNMEALIAQGRAELKSIKNPSKENKESKEFSLTDY